MTCRGRERWSAFGKVGSWLFARKLGLEHPNARHIQVERTDKIWLEWTWIWNMAFLVLPKICTYDVQELKLNTHSEEPCWDLKSWWPFRIIIRLFRSSSGFFIRLRRQLRQLYGTAKRKWLFHTTTTDRCNLKQITKDIKRIRMSE